MRVLDGKILLSASDLTRYMGCGHATTLDFAYLQGRGPKPRADTEDAELLQKYGFAHEANYLAKLKSQGRTVLELNPTDLVAVSIATEDAMRQGVDVIYQGGLLQDGWGGWADFIERVATPSKLGSFSYEVVDTKLKRSVHPKHVLQLVLYSDLIEKIQGQAPRFAYIELGNGERETLRLADYAQYARTARNRLEAFVENPQPTRPIPCTDCALCRWVDHCTDLWQTGDSLFTVANISRGQVKRLEAAGIDTMASLAETRSTVRGMALQTLEKLKAQARLQHDRKSGPPRFELRPAQDGKGFALLPEPQEGDIFYDIEGDPHFSGGLEYLHGVWLDGTFQAFWAHDHTAEKQALIDLFAFFAQRLAAFPNARIYHYAPYEVTALKRLTDKYGVGEAFRDRLLQEKRFVDLYAVVRAGLTCSEPNYSIKSLELFYGLTREGEVKTAGGSVVAYERWRETGDPLILDEIMDYNRIDCISTQQLRDWLISIRPDAPWPSLGVDASERSLADAAEAQALQDKLAVSGLSAKRQEQLFNLGRFHKREAKPAWRAIFESLGKEDQDLVDDFDVLAGLEAIGKPYAVMQSQERIYCFPPQETKLKAGDTASVPTPEGFASVNISALNRIDHTVKVKVGNARAHLLADRLSLHPNAPLNTGVIANALQDVITDQIKDRSYRAVDDLLLRSAPRLSIELTAHQIDTDPVAATIAAVHAMDETVLPIQGPPGTGKTHVTARAILSLVRGGHRVGVTSNSHEAIRNVLLGCLRAVEDEDLTIQLDLLHKISAGDGGYPAGTAIETTTDNAVAAAGRGVVGGTAFFFARDENIQAFDWLFVDEAGQVGLANMVAIGRAARNIVLVGDPQQLAQVIQGAHPPPANLSCLEWVLAEQATIPADRGLFLAKTHRMHPAVNQFVSDHFYEGRLKSHPDTAGQAILGTIWPEAGAFWVPVDHDGNAQVAAEEVAAIQACCATLLNGQWRDKAGKIRPMRKSDIIVVAPYNAQVNALRAELPDGIRVGTVDKFQGQEAPVCIVSMTASSTQESPRGMEFLLSVNRMNVAISRAKSLALVFGNPSLRHAKCENITQMRLVNVICGLKQLNGS